MNIFQVSCKTDLLYRCGISIECFLIYYNHLIIFFELWIIISAASCMLSYVLMPFLTGWSKKFFSSIIMLWYFTSSFGKKHPVFPVLTESSKKTWINQLIKITVLYLRWYFWLIFFSIGCLFKYYLGFLSSFHYPELTKFPIRYKVLCLFFQMLLHLLN